MITNTTINKTLLFMHNQMRQGLFGVDVQTEIEKLKQKKLTNYQRKLLHKIEMEASKFDGKGNE